MSNQMDVAASLFTTKIHHDAYDYIQRVSTDFTGRRALITGASKGIGQAIAVALARAGYSHLALLARGSVALTAEKARDAAQKSGKSPPEILELSADLVSATSIDDAASKLKAAFGSLDVLINNAGSSDPWSSLHDSDPDDWWRTWEVNVKGTYLVSRAFMPLLLQGQQKTLITVTSAGAWFTMTGASAYQGSKTAQVRLNNHLHEEYGKQGLIAMSIHPGGVKTDLSSLLPEELKSILLNDTPELSADTIVWLVSERREWLSDRYINCSWDMEELLAKKEEILSKNLLKLSLSC